MLKELKGLLEDELEGLALFEHVGSALVDDQVKSPSAQIFLAADSEVSGNTTLRELAWMIQVRVDHSESAGEAEELMLDLLDAVRNRFNGWAPAGVVGFQNKTVKVPEIKIINFIDHGPTEYAVRVDFRVSPEMFSIS